ncbi:hypothetical protein M407DRAFT_26750 [Tulasnella calospora MUT 4182]|uniref:Uncharacterized protein n=1 Tax=Tulasnella calospora MUT 4182 TaxID=1051891 RepID=A0A0C3QDU1_9AGAM|nr:hypothetical protein M407DRAFT_26750 [Tulasnella calospora MUT 4182]
MSVESGAEGLSCHQFIRAIREQARAAGKQRDDQWMADYVCVCFDGEALKWFESLEDETQSDWKLLRRAILARYYAEPVYEGATDKQPGSTSPPRFITTIYLTSKDKDDCRKFVRTIRLRATAAGKIDDSSWMCKAAYPCFAGNSLEWYVSLSVDVQKEWRLLERAILMDYPLSPTLAISPARIRIDDWFSAVPPSWSLQSIRSNGDWLAQARERRRMYLEAKDPSIPCWLLVENGDDLPQHSLRTGFDKSGPLYSARVWHGGGLLLGKCGKHIDGAHLPFSRKSIQGMKPLEVLVGDPSDFQWISIPEKASDGRGIRHRPFWGVDAGFPETHRTSLVQRIRHNFGWIPGKAHTGQTVGFCSDEEQELERATIIVLAWAN